MVIAQTREQNCSKQTCPDHVCVWLTLQSKKPDSNRMAMPSWTNVKFPILLQFLLTLLNIQSVSHRRSNKETPNWLEEKTFLNPKTLDDVQELLKVLHKADLEYARHLLELFDSIRKIRNETNDLDRIEKRRNHLETIEKGEYHPGIGWVWKGNIVPEPTATTAFYERRHRIIANGAWNQRRKGWEYHGHFFGIWD